MVRYHQMPFFCATAANHIGEMVATLSIISDDALLRRTVKWDIDVPSLHYMVHDGNVGSGDLYTVMPPMWHVRL
jgi:hypothetical protein